MDGAIAAAGQNGVATPADSFLRMRSCACWLAGFEQVGGNARGAEYIKSAVNG